MKCPYNDFTDCIVEKCPACEYETIKREKWEGQYPTMMPLEVAEKEGYAWKTTVTEYKFKACKLAEKLVAPVLRDKTVIENNTKNYTDVSVRKSIF